LKLGRLLEKKGVSGTFAPSKGLEFLKRPLNWGTFRHKQGEGLFLKLGFIGVWYFFEIKKVGG